MVNPIFDTTVRKPFRFLPAIVWAIAIDALDLVSNVITGILTMVFGVGLGLDLLFDLFQMFLAAMIFENPAFIITNVDLLLPPGFDIFPAYTAKVLAIQMKIVR